jgi:GH43 family beta-xylosidase
MQNWDDDFDDKEYERERKEEEQRVANLPIVKKAKDLFVTINAFVETFSDDEDTLDLKSSLFNNVAIINAKISGAEAGDLYSIRMENAVLIKVHAVDIKTTAYTIEIMGIGDTDYIDIIRNEVDEFRKIFVEWVATFDRTNNMGDEWGIWTDS